MTDMTPSEQVKQWLQTTRGDPYSALELAAIEKGILGWHASAGYMRAKPPHKTMPARGAPPSIDIPPAEPDDE